MDRNFIAGAILVIAVAAGASLALQRRDESDVSSTPAVKRSERASEYANTGAKRRAQPSSPIDERR
ncbi:MAG: hypothetical protein ABW171_02185, partial [Steroidobacter sp.]